MATVTKLNRTKGEAYLIRFVHPTTKQWVRKIVHCSRVEAENIRKQIDADIAFGKFNIQTDYSSRYLLSDLITRYYVYAPKVKSIKTVKRETLAIDAFQAFLGEDIKLSDLGNETMENFKISRLSRGLAPATVSIELRALKTIFNQGIKWDLLENNPVKGVSLPKADIIQVRFLRQHEIKALLRIVENAGDRLFKPLIVAYLNTGARRTELLPPLFTWDNVDFHERRLLLRGKGNKKRYIPMNDSLVDLFREIKSEGSEVPFGVSADYVTHRVKKYYRLAGIHGANVHSLRKTFGSLLLQHGLADLYTVSKLLGHSSLRTTEKYYVDLLDQNYRESVSGLGEIIEDRPKKSVL